MARSRAAARLHLLNVKRIQAAGDGDHSDGGGLLLRVRDGSASWVFRFTASTGRRREMGLGSMIRANSSMIGDSLTTARKQAHAARELVAEETDPIQARDERRQAAKLAERAKKADQAREYWTLARCAREYHERVIEPTRTTKHGAQWISSLENHVPARIWNKPAGEIEPPELLEALRAIKPHERARNLGGDCLDETVQRIRQRLDAVFEDAIFHKRCAGNPAAAIRRKMREAANPAAQICTMAYFDEDYSLQVMHMDPPGERDREAAPEGRSALWLLEGGDFIRWAQAIAQFDALTPAEAPRGLQQMEVDWAQWPQRGDIWIGMPRLMRDRSPSLVSP